jgi:hypothetical protein
VKHAKAVPPPRRARAPAPAAIKTRFSPAYFLFNSGSFRTGASRVYEDSAEKLRETLR